MISVDERVAVSWGEELLMAQVACRRGGLSNGGKVGERETYDETLDLL